jgi:hypothetical protein
MAFAKISSNDAFRRLADAGAGFILAVKGRRARVHRAKCLHLTAFTNIDADFTSSPKYFSTSRDELAEYARAQLQVELLPCKTCGA